MMDTWPSTPVTPTPPRSGVRSAPIFAFSMSIAHALTSRSSHVPAAFHALPAESFLFRDSSEGVDRVKSVTGDASVGVIRGKARQFLDVKIEVAFRVRVGGDETAYKGTLTVKDYSADAATEPVDVEVKFSDAARVPAHVRDAVRGALGRTGAVEAGATGTFARDVVGALAAELLPGLKDL